jgi:hypothetical protein
VVDIVPYPAAVIPLVGAVLADIHDEWRAGDRRSLSEGSRVLLYPDSDNEPSPPSTAASRHQGSPQGPPPRGALSRSPMVN